MIRKTDLVILYEHPEWQKPLFEALTRCEVDFAAFDLKTACFGDRDQPQARLYFNQASPSAYLRDHTRAVPLALAFMEHLESRGARVLNGSHAFRLELSKWAQIALMRRLDIPHPRTWVFNDPAALASRAGELPFPAVLKPNQGGSGARMFRVESIDELTSLLEANPNLWFPDNLLLIQEFLQHDIRTQGIVRLEFLGGELLYAMRVVSHGNFNLCPSESCNPSDNVKVIGETCSTRSLPAAGAGQAPRFYAFPEVPKEAVRMGRRLFTAARLDIGAVEYLETMDGRRVYFDVNANSNLRRSIGTAFGLDPFQRVADYLRDELTRQERAAT